MWFYSVIFFLLLTLAGIGYICKYPKLIYWLCIFFLIIIAGLRPETCCQDYGEYINYYSNLSSIPLTFLEPTFFLISWISNLLFHSYIGIFLVYSILGVGLKGLAIVKLTKYFSVSLALYFGSYFLLHEMTQIRVGVASSILLLSIPYIQQKKPYHFFTLILLGCLFHYSLVLFMFFYAVNPKQINKKLYIVTIFTVFVITLLGLNILSVLSIIKLGFLTQKIEAYQLLLDKGMFGGISLINPLLFLRIAIATFFILYYQILLLKCKYSLVITKIYVVSILSFILLSPLPVLAGRVSQLLGVVEIILIPYLIHIIRPKYVALITVIFFSMLIMYKQLYYSDLMSGYFK
ncbi:MAG: EpsG family protein [Sphingobacteriaceae bacterium]|nr:MAG: EpsG family protein [Sphingobacteriaceae bacterium]